MKSEKDLINCTTNGVPDEYIFLRKELEVYEKALELMADELASNKHCTQHPYCYIEEDEEDCQLIEECHNKEWLMDYYLEEARKS